MSEIQLIEVLYKLWRHHQRIVRSRHEAEWRTAARLALVLKNRQRRNKSEGGTLRLGKQQREVLKKVVEGAITDSQLYSLEKRKNLSSLIKSFCPDGKKELIDTSVDGLLYQRETPWQYAVKQIRQHYPQLRRLAIRDYAVTMCTDIKDPEDSNAEEVGQALREMQTNGFADNLLDHLWKEYRKQSTELSIPKPKSGDTKHKRRGKRAQYNEEKDARLKRDWEAAHRSGKTKAKFCEEKGVKFIDLEHTLGRIRTRKLRPKHEARRKTVKSL